MITRIILAAVVGALLAGPARAASPGYDRQVAGPPTMMEAAIASCAGGAAVGALVSWGGGGLPPLPAAVLFCGLSVSATVAANLASQTWRATTFWLSR